LISDKELRQTLARAGRRRVQEFYDLKRNVTLLADVMQSCVSD
jgi:hypothetical protein